MTVRESILTKDLLLLKEKLEAADTIAISGHTRPDGDCVGSCLGWYIYLKEQYPAKQIHLYLEPISESFQFLKYADHICQSDMITEPYDLYFSMDCSDTERLAENELRFCGASYKVCVDHHISNEGFGDLRFIVPFASSTSEIVYYLIGEEEISTDCAEALYTGIVHDTGVFKHSNTTRETMEVAGALLAKGVNSSFIIDDTFYKKTYKQNQLLGKALIESVLMLDGKLIFSVLKKDAMDLLEADSSDTDGIIDQLRVTEGVECALFLYAKEDESTFKVSMRSNDLVDVSKIAKEFGGGGHVKAAGCTMKGRPRDIINNIAKRVERQLEIAEEKKEAQA